MMTEERLAEIRARVEAGTKEQGEWRIVVECEGPDGQGLRDTNLFGTLDEYAMLAHAKADLIDLLAEVKRLQHENLVLMAREARETWKTIPVEEETDGELIARFWTTFAETHGDRPDLVATAKRYAEEALADD